MKLFVIIVVLCVKGVFNDKVYGDIAEVEALLKAVAQENWNENETHCRDAVLSMLRGVQNSTLWATWMWDSMQRPMGTLYGSRSQLGNFDQCLSPPWKAAPIQPQYCLVDLQLYSGPLKKYRDFGPYESTTNYVSTKSLRGRPMNSMTWGLCMPSQCSVTSVATVARLLARITHLAPLGDPAIHVHYCHLAGETRSYGFGARAFLMTLLFFFTTTILFTLYGPRRIEKSLISAVTISFCLRRNYDELFDEKPKEISCLNGIRFLTALLVVWAHTLMFVFGVSILNGLDIDKDLESYNGIVLHHMDIIVDTFFALSGLLHINSLLSAKTPQNFIKIILKRYVRLVVAMGVAVFYLVAVSADVDNGPLWKLYAGGEQSICAKSWWKCLLMHNPSIKDMCYIISWYVPCDFQLTILGTILFFIYKNNQRNAFKAFGFLCVLSILIPGFTTYWYKLNGLTTANLEDLIYLRGIKNLDYIYINSYTRAGAYLVGIAMGYLMTVYKPENYKNVIPKIWSCLGTLLAISVMTFTLSLGTLFYGIEHSPLMAITVPMDRIAWAFAVCSIVGFCVYGDLPLINNFLSWSFFRPLGRLSYGIYTLHSLFLQRVLFSARSPFRYDHFYFIIIALGVTAVTALASFCLWLFIEAPINNITYFLLRTKTPKIEQKPGSNGAIQNDGKKVL